MKEKDFMQDFIDGLNKSGQYALSLYFQKKMIMEQFAHSKEMQKMKEEITNDVLNRISITIENKVRQALDDLFKEYLI